MTLPTFLNTRLDEDIEQGAQGGPTFLTTVMQLAGGKEKRNIEWERPRQEWDISYGIQSPEDFENVKNMFYITFGRAIGFRFKDWSDYKIGDPENYVAADAQPIGTATASQTVFQVYRTYTVGAYTYLRKITRLVNGTLKVYDNGVLVSAGVTVDNDLGTVTFSVGRTAGHVISVSCEFDVPVRFDSDFFKKKVTWTGAEELPSIAIIELKE